MIEGQGGFPVIKVLKGKILIFNKLNQFSYIFQVFDMDYEDIIKLEEESPVYSTGNNSHNLKQYMAAFYDNDSELERRDHAESMHYENHISFEQAIDFVQNYVDIVDTPLDDILLCFQRLQCGEDLDKNTLRKKILKRKQFLKRYRAKNRLPKSVFTYQHFPELTGGQLVETEAQIKKKRNRVSAQISRDRKKQYFKELQLKNQKLQEEIIRTRLENEKLKSQCQNGTQPPRSKIQSETFNNKLTKLLIFLGVICLIGMLKETFISSIEGLGKWKTGQKLGQFPGFDGKLISQQGVAKVAEFLEDEQVGRQLLGRGQAQTVAACRFEGTQGNSPDCGQLVHLMQKLDQIKTKISHE